MAGGGDSRGGRQGEDGCGEARSEVRGSGEASSWEGRSVADQLGMPCMMIPCQRLPCGVFVCMGMLEFVPFVVGDGGVFILEGAVTLGVAERAWAVSVSVCCLSVFPPLLVAPL